jgi:uncharacterized membrane protein (UPF0127 family)
MKKSFLGVAGLTFLILLFGGCNFGGVLNGDEVKDVVWLEDAEVEGPTVTIKTDDGEVVFDVEVVDTYEDRKRGLMFREHLDENRGMLFIFDEQRELGFWMKNTLIPLDMIFIDNNYRVVQIKKNAKPCKKDPCETFSSVRPAVYVLEINGGLSNKHRIKTGNIVEFNL